MKETILTIILAALGSSGLFAFVQYLITRKDGKDDTTAEIKAQLTYINGKLIIHERDQCRTQLLILIADYPEDHAEIMKLAQYYFVELKGDWYMTSIFNGWLVKQKIGKPEWFDSNG